MEINQPRVVELRDFEPVPLEILTSLPAGLIKQKKIVPVAKSAEHLIVAVTSLEGTIKPQGLALLTKCDVEFVLASKADVENFIKSHYSGEKPVAFTSAPAPETAPETPSEPQEEMHLVVGGLVPDLAQQEVHEQTPPPEFPTETQPVEVEEAAVPAENPPQTEHFPLMILPETAPASSGETETTDEESLLALFQQLTNMAGDGCSVEPLGDSFEFSVDVFGAASVLETVLPEPMETEEQIMDTSISPPSDSDYLEQAVEEPAPVPEVDRTEIEPVVEEVEPEIRLEDLHPASPHFVNLVTLAVERAASELVVQCSHQSVTVRVRVKDDFSIVDQRIVDAIDMELLAHWLKRTGTAEEGNAISCVQHKWSVVIDGGRVQTESFFSESFGNSLLTIRLTPELDCTFSPVDWGMEKEQIEHLPSMLAKKTGLILFLGGSEEKVSAKLRACATYLGQKNRHVAFVAHSRPKPIADAIEFLAHGDSDAFDRCLNSAAHHESDVLVVAGVQTPQQMEACIVAAQSRLVVVLPSISLQDFFEKQFVGSDSRTLFFSVLLGVVWEEEFRKICADCRKKDAHAARAYTGYFHNPAPGEFFSGSGCDRCRLSGYRDDCSVFSLVSDEEGAKSEDELKAQLQEGMRLMALRKAVRGETTLPEILRVLNHSL